MPRKHTRKNTRKMKGGFLKYLLEKTTDALKKTQGAATDAYNKSGLTGTAPTTYTPPPAPTTPSAPTTPTTLPPTNPTTPSTPTTPSAYGGKTRRRRRRRHMKGGFKDNTPTTGLAVYAAPFSGSTAQPHNWVGGRTKKRHHRKCYKKHRHTKSCRHRR